MIPELSEIKLLRKKLDLTQQELASRAGVSQSLLAKIESGNVEPTYGNAVKIFNVLHKEEDLAQSVTTQKIMHVKVMSVAPDTKISKAVELMRKHGISQLPVLKDEHAVGLVSEGIILDAMLEKRGELVKDIMAEPPPIVPPNTNVKVVSQLLRYYPLVIVAEKGKVKGLITKADLLPNL